MTGDLTAGRPTSAAAASLVGGLITVATTLIELKAWFAMYSSVGTAFGYSQWVFVGAISLTATAGLVFLLVGASCGVVMLVGSAMQYSGKKPEVREGSILVLIGTVIGIPATSFGWIVGGIASTLGAYLGLAWKEHPSV